MSTFGIFVKLPVPGTVKTRLAESIGEDLAAELAEAFQHDFVERTRSIASQRVIAYAGDHAGAALQALQALDEALTFWQQPGGLLGHRLHSFFTEWCRDGQPVVVVGSDSPDLPVAFVEQAFRALHDADCVLGPATDGGYYLIGLKCPQSRLFEEISWSTERVFDETLAALRSEGLSFTVLPEWYDVDTLDDLKQLREQLRTRPTDRDLPRRTQALLSRLELPQ